jgi:nitronate monooxygenase
MWPDRRIQDLFGIVHPILLAPMAGPSTAELAIAVADAGGLGAFACALSTPEQIRKELGVFRQRTSKPINLNFFVHKPPVQDDQRTARWKSRLSGYYKDLDIDPSIPVETSNREPFTDVTCAIVEEFKPEVVSFHFGLPAQDLLQRVKAAGCKVISSATTAAEAVWLADRGCDARL